MRIFVSNLAWATTEDELSQLFEPYGIVESVRIITDRDTGPNPAMTSVTPVCTLADLIPYAPTRTALIAAWRRTCAPAAVASEGDTTPRILGA